MSMVRRRVYYSGHVQGVGFRMTSQSLACDHDVGGYVRNLPDGRVELVAEGDPSKVDAFLEAVRRRFQDCVRDIEMVAETPDDPGFPEFTIRH
jgi:acylphosphatase